MLSWEDVQDPVPNETQVLIQVAAASVNYADIKARKGGYHLGRNLPFIPGIDVAGIVTDTGGRVKNLTRGDRVLAFPTGGSYSEKTIAEESLTFAIPRSMTFRQAAAVPIVAGAAYHMLVHLARMQKSESVLVHSAAGGVGCMALQISSAQGASTTIGSTGSLWKAKSLKGLGTDLVIDNTSTDYAERVMEQTGGRGVDIILNPLGGESLIRDISCLAPYGRLVVFGGKDKAVLFSSTQIYPKNQSILGCSFGYLRKTRTEAVEKTMHGVLDLMKKNAIKAVIDRQFDLPKACDAHRYLEMRKNVGKILLIVDEGIFSD